jgi:hypothetical protein
MPAAAKWASLAATRAERLSTEGNRLREALRGITLVGSDTNQLLGGTGSPAPKSRGKESVKRFRPREVGAKSKLQRPLTSSVGATGLLDVCSSAAAISAIARRLPDPTAPSAGCCILLSTRSCACNEHCRADKASDNH